MRRYYVVLSWPDYEHGCFMEQLKLQEANSLTVLALAAMINTGAASSALPGLMVRPATRHDLARLRLDAVQRTPFSPPVDS